MRVSCYPLSPLRPGDRLLLLWSKGRRFTVMPCGSKCCARQHGVQRREIDNRPGETCLWRASWRVLCLPRGGFEEGSVGVFV
jgi:hypothetical protein